MPLVVLLLFLSFAEVAGAGEGVAPGPSIIGIDHIPTAVRNLDQATETYRKLGFALKPGRLHDNGIRNNHVKFADGSGIELTSPPLKPTDELTSHYIAFLKHGDGPAYMGFHARRPAELSAALKSSGFKLKAGGDGMELDEPLLNFVFIGGDNRSPTDRPEHFAHANSAVAMSGVWLALDDAQRERMAKFLFAMGAKQSKERVFVSFYHIITCQINCNHRSLSYRYFHSFFNKAEIIDQRIGYIKYFVGKEYIFL